MVIASNVGVPSLMRIMRWTVFVSALVVFYSSATAQPGSGGPVFHSASTMVTVPALVRRPSGEFATNVRADDFTLYDNGIRQTVELTDTDSQPIALVVAVQTGGIASRHFLDYIDLPPFLDWLTAGTNRELMFVTFDSRVQIIWHFPLRSDGVAYSVRHLHAGDQGAATIDAVQFAVNQLQSEPGTFRRIVLLISQEKDDCSTIPLDRALRTLGEASTAVYSLTFNAPARKINSKRGLHRFDYASPLAQTLDALREHTASELAGYTGGAHLSFSTRSDFDEDIKAVAADIRSRRTLTFQPNGHEPGLHLLKLEVRYDFSVTARSGYWFDPVGSDP
jgi:VWFA-related protein